MADRNWVIDLSPHTHTCNECGRSIVPNDDFYRDTISGHLVRHLECHGRAEGKSAVKP